MPTTVSVSLPEAVWDDVLIYEAYQPALDAAVRERLRAAMPTSRRRAGHLPEAGFRLVTMTRDQMGALEAWLATVVLRDRAPIAAATALTTVREALGQARVLDGGPEPKPLN